MIGDFLPLQTNLLPYWFFPWNTNSWSGFTPFIFHKELLAIDALRQIFVWKEFAFSQIRLGGWPLWNPYSFSGQPLLANFQSSVFYPLSWFFMFLPPMIAWAAYVFSQPLLLVTFMFFWMRPKVGAVAALFAALALATASFFATRYFWGVYVHSLLWIPLGLGLIDRYKEAKIKTSSFVASFSLVCVLTVLGGYPQFGLYAIALLGAYYLYIFGKKRLLLFLLSLILALLISAVQLIPTAELYRYSLREGTASARTFSDSLLSPKYLATIVYPDMFGSPAVNDYTGGKDYSGVNGYFGVVPFLLASGAAIFLRRDRQVRFWIAVGALGLLLAYDNPFARLPQVLPLPIISSGNAWHNLFFFQFAGVVLATILLTRLPKRAILICLLLTTFLGFYYSLKVSPFGQTKYFYPPHPLLSWLRQNAGLDRFYGYRSSHFLSNLSTYYRIYSPEGYDSLWPSWYGELLSSADRGKVPPEVNRADVSVTDWDTSYRRKLLNLLGVKYFLDKSDKPGGDQGPNLAKYPAGQFVLRKQWGEVSIYENKEALPRAFLADGVISAPKSEVIEKIYSLPSLRTIILDSPPGLGSKKLTTGSASIKKYLPNEVIVTTNSPGNSLLFLSDTYFPGWDAFVDGHKAKILRADYAFRAVPVPPGKNEVRFIYQPKSFFLGISMSLLGSAIWLWLLLKNFFKKTG
ncbi:MAG: hypothetical protein UY21_C0001G0071 [Microgenomates group bacterium GW2011_GWA1_48_10]|nr:MAG: hypothetical protein UY21_C0001G0071 [Microgenomates group bacterium GW2011_GWA1_48_10]